MIISVFLYLFHPVERMAYHKFCKNRTKVKVTKNTNSIFTNMGITFEPMIIETSDWHQNVCYSTHHHTGWSNFTLVQWPLHALEVEIFYVKVNFPKSSILVRFCSNLAHRCMDRTWMPMSNIETIRETVDVTPISIATIV